MEESMPRTKYLAILVAAIAAFVFSSLYYSPLLLGGVWRSVDPVVTAAAKLSAAKALVEFLRTLVITLVIARILAMLQVVEWKSACSLPYCCGLVSQLQCGSVP